MRAALRAAQWLIPVFLAAQLAALVVALLRRFVLAPGDDGADGGALSEAALEERALTMAALRVDVESGGRSVNTVGGSSRYAKLMVRLGVRLARGLWAFEVPSPAWSGGLRGATAPKQSVRRAPFSLYALPPSRVPIWRWLLCDRRPRCSATTTRRTSSLPRRAGLHGSCLVPTRHPASSACKTRARSLLRRCSLRVGRVDARAMPRRTHACARAANA